MYVYEMILGNEDARCKKVAMCLDMCFVLLEN